MPATSPDPDDLAALEAEREALTRRLAELATYRRQLRRAIAAAPPAEPKSEDAIARDLGLSRRQVRRLLHRALSRLRHELTKPIHQP